MARTAWLATFTSLNWKLCNGLCATHNLWVHHTSTPLMSQSTATVHVFFYGKHFTFSPQHKAYNNDVEVVTTALGINMFILHWHFRSNGQCMGNIYPLSSIQEPVELIPIFGQQMDQNISYNNSLDLPTSFYLNNFWDKETFHSILTYQ